MADKTAQERILDLEQAVLVLEGLVSTISKQLPVYDKIIQTQAKKARALKKARAVKRKKAK